MPEFGYKTMFGEEARIKNPAGLPKELYMSIDFHRDRVLAGRPDRCVGFSMWRLQDQDDQPVQMASNFRWQGDDELQAYRLSLTCVLRDVEAELASREEYKKTVAKEIEGFTGSEPGSPAKRGV